jgi:hypothetical protein
MFSHPLETDRGEWPVHPRRSSRLPITDTASVDIGQTASKQHIVQVGQHTQAIGVAHRVIRAEILPKAEQVTLHHRIISTRRPRFHKREGSEIPHLLAHHQGRLGSVCALTVAGMVITETEQTFFAVAAAGQRAGCLQTSRQAHRHRPADVFFPNMVLRRSVDAQELPYPL